MSQAEKTVSIVTAVYYNAESLPLLLGELQVLEERLAARGLGLELIFVNDGSGDNSLQELLKIKAARPATKVINLSRNFGGVAAVKTGFKFVTGDVFAILAADLQDPPEQILAMVEEWLAGHKFVVSVRAERDDPLSSRLFSSVYYKLLDWVVIRDYPEGGYDLMLMDKVMLPYMANSTKHTNPNVFAFWLGFAPKVLSYHRRARLYGKSRWTFRKKLRFLIDTVCGFSAAPLKIVASIGVVAAFASFLYGTVILTSALFGRTEVPGFATLATLLSFFSGLILFMLGLIGEYIWRIFEAVNHKPESVVEKEYI